MTNPVSGCRVYRMYVHACVRAGLPPFIFEPQQTGNTDEQAGNSGISGEGEDSQVSFEKHKIFLYKEDFEKFTNGLQQAIQFIADEQGLPEPRQEEKDAMDEEQSESLSESEIKIDIDF